MDPLLQILFGQQAGSLVGAAGVDENGIPITVGNDITVQGGPPQQQTPERQPLQIPDRPDRQGQFILDDTRVPPTKEELQEILPRQGAFGLKGTLRDILGYIGDAFLVQSGNKPVFAPQRQQERLGDALFGFTQNPQQAAERLAGAGFGAEATGLIEQEQNSALKQAQLRSLDASRQSLIDDRKFGNIKDATTSIARIFGSVQGQANSKAAVRLAELLAKRAGITLEDLGISPNITPEEMDLFSRSDITVNQTEALPRRDEQLRINQQNANSRSTAVAKPKTGSNPTEASIAAPLLQKLIRGETLTPAEREVLDRTAPLPGKKGKKSLGGSLPLLIKPVG